MDFQREFRSERIAREHSHFMEHFPENIRNRLRIEQGYSIKNRSARLQKRRESRLRGKAWRKRKDRLVAKTRGKALRRVCANAIRKMHKRR